MKKIEIINVEIFNTSVAVCIGINKEDLDILKEDNPDKIDDDIYKQLLEDIENANKCSGFATTVNDGSYLMFIREGFENNFSIVIHELFHITNFILYDRDIYYERTAETFAYLIGWLSEQYFNIVNAKDEKDFVKELELEFNNQ